MSTPTGLGNRLRGIFTPKERENAESSEDDDNRDNPSKNLAEESGFFNTRTLLRTPVPNEMEEILKDVKEKGRLALESVGIFEKKEDIEDTDSQQVKQKKSKKLKGLIPTRFQPSRAAKKIVPSMNLPGTSSAVDDEEEETKCNAQEEIAIEKKKIELMEPIALRHDTDPDYAEHFESCFRTIQGAGASEFEAAIFADNQAQGYVKALKKDKKTKTKKLSTPEAELLSGFYSNQQQQQAVALLSQMSGFSGKASGIRFEDWINNFEAIMNTAQWEDGRKTVLLCSKLTTLASDAVINYKQNHPIESKSYKNIKKCLQERFHGSETRIAYATEYKNCERNPGEQIRDYACRLQKLFSHAYPLDKKDAGTQVTTYLEKVLKDKFIDGLPLELRKSVKCKEFDNFERLVKETMKRSAALEESVLEKRQRETINNVNFAGALKTDTVEKMLESNKVLMAEMMAQNATMMRNLFSTAQNVAKSGKPKQTAAANTAQAPPSNAPSYYCEGCKKPGHTLSHCKFLDTPPGCCFRCKQPGHYSSNCPNIPKQQQNPFVPQSGQPPRFNANLENWQPPSV